MCGRCRRDAHRRRATCTTCQEPDRLLDDRGLCRWCRERAARRCANCHQNRTLTTVAGEQLCGPCSLRRTVDGLLADHPPGALHCLRAPILGAEPMTTRRWLRRPAIAALLTALDSGRLPLTHATMDAQPPTRAVEHLRDLLLATGALDPDRDRLIDRLQQDSDQILAALASGPATIGDLVPRLYADVDPRLHPAAARSMLAAMIHLVRQGRLAADGAPGPLATYRVA